jgi:hypothetical protein
VCLGGIFGKITQVEFICPKVHMEATAPKKRGRKPRILDDSQKRELEERRRKLNRASACESRIRKKNYVATLEADYDALMEQKERLLKEIDELRRQGVSFPFVEETSSSSSSSSPLSIDPEFDGLSMLGQEQLSSLDLNLSFKEQHLPTPIHSLLELPYDQEFAAVVSSRDGFDAESNGVVDVMTSKSAALDFPPQLELVVMLMMFTTILQMVHLSSFQVMLLNTHFPEFLMSKRILRGYIEQSLETLKNKHPHYLAQPPII